ncbi:MAG: PQQ-binding-like beta-propeller repeat protein [Pirellulaceae bacterium]|nr:PQQ-binding-like beta-propeller repeat protein [Pirellulaceae bacterium]
MKKRTIVAVLGGAVLIAGGVAFYTRPSTPQRPRLDDFSASPSVALPDSSATEPGSTKLVAFDDSAEALPSWHRFRGPNGSGVSDEPGIPDSWSDTQNLAWKTELPGSGASSPVLTAKHVFVTSYSGYGEEGRTGSIQQLKRHVSCIDRADGRIVWTKSFDNEHREDPYEGMGLPEHGYATNTPVTDGKFVYAFLGKSGVIALDMDGNERWRVSVGTSSGNRGWGSAASLLLYNNLVIVNASEESQALIALNKTTGAQVWKAEASTLESCYSTPVIVKVNETRDDLVIAVPGEVWGMNPHSGKLTWFVETSLTGNLSPGIIVDGETLYAFGGYRSSGSLAIKTGGKGDVTDSHILWESKNSSYVATPVLIGRRLHWIDDRGLYYCTSADTGELIRRDRVPQIDSGGRPVYASPIAVNGKLIIQTRNSGALVIEPGETLTVLAKNKFESDRSVFNATPAVDTGQLFLRSNAYLYCVSKP